MKRGESTSREAHFGGAEVLEFNEVAKESTSPTITINAIGSDHKTPFESFEVPALDDEIANNVELHAWAEKLVDIIHFGTWGSCRWMIDKRCELTVFPGEGAGMGMCPWQGHKGYIRSVKFVSEGGEKVILPADSSWLFSGMKHLMLTDLSAADFSRVENAMCLFYGCYSLDTLDLSHLDTSSTTDMRAMFRGCSSLTSLNLSGWDVSNVMDMGDMFEGCSSLSSLDLSGWDTSKATDASYMFYDCSELKKIVVGDNWSMRDVISSDHMFQGCKSLTGGNGTSYRRAQVSALHARPDMPGTPGYLTFKANLMLG